MPHYTKPMNSMGGEYTENFGGTLSPHIWLSGEKVGVGTAWLYAHPLGVGTPAAVIIPTGVVTTFAGTVSVSTQGFISCTVTTGGTYKILALM